MVVGFNVLRGDVDAGPEALLNETENLKAVAQVSFNALGGEIVRGEETFPTVVGGAVFANAGGEFLADLGEAYGDFAGLGLGGLLVFPANLLLNQSAADELVERSRARERAHASTDRIENREANLFVDVAGEDDVTVDDRFNTVNDHGRSRGQGLDENRIDCEAGEKDGSKAHAGTARNISACGTGRAPFTRAQVTSAGAREVHPD